MEGQGEEQMPDGDLRGWAWTGETPAKGHPDGGEPTPLLWEAKLGGTGRDGEGGQLGAGKGRAERSFLEGQRKSCPFLEVDAAPWEGSGSGSKGAGARAEGLPGARLQLLGNGARTEF